MSAGKTRSDSRNGQCRSIRNTRACHPRLLTATDLQNSVGCGLLLNTHTRYFFVENAEVTRGTFYSRPTDSLQRAASTFVALLTATESLRGARIPVRDLGARLRRPPWVRSFCRRASSRACGSRYAPPSGRSPRAPSPSASAHPFPLSSSPPDRTTPRPRAASRRDHHPGNARRRPRAPQGSERCPRGPVAEHARGTRSPRRPRRDGPADPILDETRRDVEARAFFREKKSASRRTRRTNATNEPR